jgi:hypothetical protein
LRSITATAGSLENLATYTAAGGLTPTGIVFDARTAQRFFVADDATSGRPRTARRRSPRA